MTHIEFGRKHGRLSASIAFAALLLSTLPAHGQYMSFFGDNTWEYNITYLTNPPEDYIDYPPENPSPLNVYCRTYRFKYSRSAANPESHYYFPLWHDINSFPHIVFLHEDTMHGHLFVQSDSPFEGAGTLVCDMSLNEGDTFVLKDPCFYPAMYAWGYDTIGDRHMIVDSVTYIAGRKTIFLSLIDHLDDYFFGTEYATQHADNPFTIRFIEGVGPTYGSLPGCRDPRYGADLYPYFGLLLCMYKDDSLLYMADERLGCYQACVGLPEYSPPFIMNLYPNPATQYVMLDLSTGEDMNGSVTITDMLGRHRLQQKAEGCRCRIPVAELPAGMYFLTYRDSKRTVTKKFLKE
jgi:hypothetical protein